MLKEPDLPRVAHIGWLASSHLERRATELARQGVPTVVFTDHIPSRLMRESLPFRVEVLPGGLTRFPQQLVKWLEERLRVHNIEILHIHSTHFPAALGLFVRDVPRVTSIWDFVYSRDTISPLYHKIILDELLRGRLSEFVSFSSKVVMERWIKQGFPKSRALWHSWGVDLDRFSKARNREEIRKLRERHGIGPDSKLIFSPRTPSLQANVDLLLQALPLVNEKLDVTCIVTGHAIPPETRYLERIVKRSAIRHSVRFIETIHNQALLSHYYQASDMVVSLHSNDHNPASVLEAMAAGALVLINESPEVEFWIRDGQNGLVVKTRNLKHLSKKLTDGLNLDPFKKKAWRKFNRAFIKKDANFRATIHQVICDYERIRRIPPLTHYSDFHHGLLADICGDYREALRLYERARDEKQKSPYLEPVIREKRDFIEKKSRITAFHTGRANPNILKLSEIPTTHWQKKIDLVEYPKSLFRHDIIAGFYPLLRERRFDDLLFLIDLLSDHFHTDNLEWLSESVNWFGERWGLWEECSEILLKVKSGGTSLGCHALRAAEELGEGHGHYRTLLEKAAKWTSCSIDMINPELDRKYRREINEAASRLLSMQRMVA